MTSKLCLHFAVRDLTDEHMEHAVTVPEAAEAATPPTTLSTLLDQDWAPLYLANAVLLCSGDDVARGAHDVLSFAAACRASRVVRLLPPRHLADGTFRNHQSQYAAFEWHSLSARPGGLHLAAVLVQCMWKDQGWGNQKGMLSVVKEGGHAPNDYTAWGSDVIVGCEPAPHTYQKLDLSFRPATDAVRYQLFARAGGGGGHSLSVTRVQVRDLAIVDSEAALERYVREMQQSGRLLDGAEGGEQLVNAFQDEESESEEGESEESESEEGDESE